MSFICIECGKEKDKSNFRMVRNQRNLICNACFNEKKKKLRKKTRFCRGCRKRKPKEEFERDGKKEYRICNTCLKESYQARLEIIGQSKHQKGKSLRFLAPGIYSLDEVSALQIEKSIKRYWIDGVEHVRE